MNDAERLSQAPTFRLIGSEKIRERGAGLTRINRELIAKGESAESPRCVVLDMDSSEIPVYGQQEHSAYNGHFESTCYHPLRLFNRDGDCLAAKLRPGNVHSAESWEKMLLPESCFRGWGSS